MAGRAHTRLKSPHEGTTVNDLRSTAGSTASTARSKSSNWTSIQEWPLRRKVAAALALPVLLAVIFGGLRVQTQLSEASDLSAVKSQAVVLGPAVEFAAATETLAAAAGPQTTPGSTTALSKAKTRFDKAEKGLRDAMGTADLDEETLSDLQGALTIGTNFRANPISRTTGTPEGVFETSRQVNQVTDRVDDVITAISDAQPTPDPNMTVLQDIRSGRSALSSQRILTSLPASGVTAQLRAEIQGAGGRESASIRAIPARVGAQQIPLLQEGNRTRTAIYANVGTDQQVTRARQSGEPSLTAYDTLTMNTVNSINSTLTERMNDARISALRDAALIIGALLAALAFALLIARSLLEPIRRVREGALDVAQNQLPTAIERIRAGHEPAPATAIDVHTKEEMGQLARAVDDMHSQALLLAGEQARLRTQVGDMFETLSRRSTTLVNQQLNLIEKLERDEDDPNRLESLFRLDHLAARMRRNGENLLVLAGASSRRSKQADLALADVLRAAISEVQDYQRVTVSASTQELWLNGAIATDVVHLFAEIIDNALTYSPPESQVIVSTARAVDGGTLVEVADEGLGMAADDIETTNRGLDFGGEVTPDTARRMGLFVVGRLAQRHGIKVRLRTNNQNERGIIASVFLPASALALSRRERQEKAAAAEAPRRHVEAVPNPPAEIDAPTARPRPQGVPSLPTRTPAAPSLRAAESEPDEFLAKYPERSSELPTVVGLNGSSYQDDPDATEQIEIVPPAGPDLAPPEPPRLAGLPQRRPGASGAGTAVETTPEPEVSPTEAFERPAPTNTSSFFSARERATTGPVPLRQPTHPETDDIQTSSWNDSASFDSTSAGDTDSTESTGSTSSLAPFSTGWRADSYSASPISSGSTSSANTSSESTFDEQPALDVPNIETYTPLHTDPPELDEDPFGGPADEPADELSSTDRVDALLGDAQTPIFQTLRSRWLTDDEPDTVSEWSPSDIDAGWKAAREVEHVTAADHTNSGLPVRQPGARLVPGTTASEDNVSSLPTRDPEMIRRILSGHADGVTRGRAAIHDESGFGSADKEDD